MLCFYFFNDTATTESYTYGLTLSQHDALPISAPIWAPMKRSKRVVPIPVMTASTSTLMPEETMWPRTRSAMKAVRPKKAKGMSTKPASVTSLNRSEEHTSELQSLMRISYAVFCLKKKKQQQNRPETINT